MIWRELLTHLDELRSRLRAEHGKELDKEIPEGDALVKDVWETMALAPAVLPTTTIDDVFAIAPEREPDKPGSKRMAASSVEGASLIVEPRDKPFVPKKPVLEEVLEEELGK